MAHHQRLKLTLRNVGKDMTWTNQPLEVTADPEDDHTLLDHLEAMARALDGRTGTAWWADQYTMRIQGLEQEWRDRTIWGGSH